MNNDYELTFDKMMADYFRDSFNRPYMKMKLRGLTLMATGRELPEDWLDLLSAEERVEFLGSQCATEALTP